MADRFVVRSVTGWPAHMGTSQNAKAVPSTLYHVSDSLDCYRVVFEPGNSANNRLFQCEQIAKRLNAEREARHG